MVVEPDAHAPLVTLQPGFAMIHTHTHTQKNVAMTTLTISPCIPVSTVSATTSVMWRASSFLMYTRRKIPTRRMEQTFAGVHEWVMMGGWKWSVIVTSGDQVP